MPRSGTGWSYASPGGVFTRRGYCPNCTKLTYESEQTGTLDEKYRELDACSFERLFCSAQCAGQFIYKVEQVLRRICTQEQAVMAGIEFFKFHASLPSGVDQIIANLEEEVKKVEALKNDSRDSSGARRKEDSPESESPGGDENRGVSKSRIILVNPARKGI